MAPTELREARQKLGLSAAGLAKALRLGANGGRTVRRWEAGGPIPGPAQVAIELMLEKTAA
jgi:DNA-binding transcriptional regulator YiaG